MDLLVYILPVVLFIITLIIILALRAEDRKSRSLQTVKEKILSFRNESQQTIVRIQETCHDCTDKINAKREEAEEAIAAMSSSLDNLKSHHRDLASLESICKSYEIALEKLRLQTEHAESRISVVQDEVKKAEEVNSTIATFKQDARSIEDNLKAVQVEYKELVENTNNELDAIAKEHEEREKSLLVLFSDELSKSREEFGTFIDEIRDDIESRKSSISALVSSSTASLEQKQQEADALFEENKGALEETHKEMMSTLASSNSALESKMNELTEFFDKKKSEAEVEREDFASALASGKSSLSDLSSSLIEGIKESGEEATALINSRRREHEASFSNLETLLEENESKLKAQIEALSTALTEKLTELTSRKDELSNLLSEEEEAFKRENEKIHSDLAATTEEAVKQIQSELSAAVSALSSSLGDSKAIIASEAEEASSAVNETKRMALLECEEQKANLASDESVYIDHCREKLRAIMAEEVDKIDGIFKAMSKTAEDSIANLIKRQSEIKETVSLHNQGASETIAATVDRLQTLQNRLNVSEASLADTQKQVTTTKEDLYNLQEEHRRIQSEVLQATKNLETEQDKAAEAKRNRIEEEAKLVRLKLESEAYSKPSNKSEEKKESTPKKKSSVQMSTFPEDIEYTGEEEEIPLDDDN